MAPPSTTRVGSPTVPLVLLGIGLGGFVDGIVLHQLLQWHHLLTDHGQYAEFPALDVEGLQVNILWDGLFHVVAWGFVAVGLVLLWRATATGHRIGWRSFVGLLMAGWGLFNLVEGVISHHLLAIHHVRDDVADPLPWDLGFLALGAALVVGGLALHRRDRPARQRAAATASSTSTPSTTRP